MHAKNYFYFNNRSPDYLTYIQILFKKEDIVTV